MAFREKNFLNLKRAKVVSPLDRLKEALDKLEKEENRLREKASKEVVTAKEFTRAEDETVKSTLREKASKEVVTAKEFTRAEDETVGNAAAIQCSRSKKLYEQQIEQLGNLKLRIRDQMIMLEGGEAAAWAVDALKIGAEAMKAMYIRDVDNVICHIDEQNESMKQMLEAVSAPSGAVALFDEDELKAELAELKGAERDLSNL